MLIWTNGRNNLILSLDLDSIKSAYSGSLLENSSRSRPKRSLDDSIANAPSDALDLLKLLLQFNPEKRLTAEEALSHPYVAKFHKPDEESFLSYDIVPPVDDDVQLTVQEYREKLYEVLSLLFLTVNIGRFCYSSEIETLISK